MRLYLAANTDVNIPEPECPSQAGKPLRGAAAPKLQSLFSMATHCIPYAAPVLARQSPSSSHRVYPLITR
jgi:hypothetical protein